MRQPNDILLAQQVPEIDAVLGGHDHHYNVRLLYLVLFNLRTRGHSTRC
jgi:hypothetical protein